MRFFPLFPDYFGNSIWPWKMQGVLSWPFFLEEIMKSAVALATFLINDEVKNELIKFLKSKDFENLSVKEKKEFIIELKNTSYSLKNLYNLFALSYERLLKEDDSTFSDLDTLLSVFVEEFNNIQKEELGKMISKNKSKYKKTTAAELEAYFAEQFKNIQTEEFEKNDI